MNLEPEEKQLNYYKKTANDYERTHVKEDSPRSEACRLISLLCNDLEVSSILDTGCGTGIFTSALQKNFPNAKVIGNDPSKDLLKIAEEKNKIPKHNLYCCSSYSLPFENESFDVVTEFGMLHHVEKPERVVMEMLRVARKAVFISDSNRFGQGKMPIRLTKLILYNLGLWWPLRKLANGGKKWSYSEGDGIYYSYSVFDNLGLVQSNCSRVFLIPIAPDNPKPSISLIGASSILVCGFK